MEPMDTDEIGEFDNKENSTQYSNLPNSTEKGYEELDVSELNMKLRYSITPVSSPMSKSCTANCVDINSQDSELNNTVTKDNCNLTQSLNSVMNSTKTLKPLPLQPLPLDGTVTLEKPNNITVTITGSNDHDANSSFPSSSSSLTDTPEATTPVTEVPKPSGSPILRGLKSVLSMFRASQSPIPSDENQPEEEVASPPVVISPNDADRSDSRPNIAMVASTPLTTNRRQGTNRCSPLKERMVFNDDLEKELAWKDEPPVIFNNEKVPIHKLFFQHQTPSRSENKAAENKNVTSEPNFQQGVEPMDISFSNSTIKDQTMTETVPKDLSIVNDKDLTTGNNEKDESVFLDCETTFSMDISQALDVTKENIDIDKPINKVFEYTEANLNASLESQTAKQDETNISMFSAEFQPELEEVNVDKEANNEHRLFTVTDFNQAPLAADILAPLPENLHDIMPNSTPLNEIISAVTNTVEDHKTLEHNEEDYILNTDKVPESIQKTLDETWNRMDGTQCFDDTVDVISRIEAAIRQQDDEFLDSPANFEKEELETTLANLVNDASKDATQSTDQSANITVKDLEATDLSKTDVSYIAENVPLPSESDDDQDKNNCASASNQPFVDGNDVSQKTNTADAVPKVEEIDNAIEFKSNAPLNYETTINIHETIPSSEKNQTTENAIQEIPLVDKLNTIQFNEQTQFHESSPVDSIMPVLDTNCKALTKQDTEDLKEIPDRTQVTLPEIIKPIDVEKKSEEAENEKSETPTTKERTNEIELSTTTEVIANEIQETKDPKEIDLVDKLTIDKEDLPTMNNINSLQPNFTISQDTQEPIHHKDQEIVVSENNSPFVSLGTEDEDFSDTKRADSVQNIDIVPSKSKESESEQHQEDVSDDKVGSRPPSSPKLPGKGQYNFNFDEMDDPFATKSHIRASPPSDCLDQTCVIEKGNNSLSKTFTEPSKSTLKLNTTVNLGNNMDESTEIPTADTTVCLDKKDSEPRNIELFNATIDIPTPKTDLTYDFNKLDMTNHVEDALQSNSPVANDISTKVNDQTSNANETRVLENADTNSDRPENAEANEVYEEAKDDTSEKEQESLDDFAIEENKISAEINSFLQEKTKRASSSEQSTYLSAGTSLSDGSELKSLENMEATFNPFVTKSKICQSPPPITSEENPFATRSKIAASPVTSFIATVNKVIDVENANLEAKVASQEARLADDNVSTKGKITSHLDGTGSDSSGTTDEKDVTIKEVHTEDEDTEEGPFIEAELEDEALKLNPDNMFKDTANINLDDVDMNQFSDLLAQPNEENFEAGEMFIDANAFEFLMNQNKSNELDDRGKESLFLKFDPLFAKRVNSDGIVEALAKLQKRQSTPKKVKPVPTDLISLGKSSIAGASNAEMSIDESHEEMNVTVSQKPTMVVPPAVNPAPTPRQNTSTPTRANRLSLNFASPAMAAIDRLLSMSANNSLVSQDAPEHVRRENAEADRALTQFRELLAEKEMNVQHLRFENRDLRDRLANLESQMSSLETESAKRLKNIEEMNKELDEKDKQNKCMASVVEEFERTIASLIAGIEEDKKAHAEEKRQLIIDRDEQIAHLSSMEVAFNDLHSKYEKCKQIILSYKSKEETYKNAIKDFEENLKKMEKNYEALKQHATSKLNFANQELEKINKKHETDLCKLNAMLKRKEMHISSLEETLAQKSKANEELTAICDELINKVG